MAERPDGEEEPKAGRRRFFKLNRRQLLGLGLTSAATGGAGLALGFWGGSRYERRLMRVPPREQPFSPNVFLALDHDGTTTVWVTRSEMGQGVSTALPMIVADAMDADWSRVRIEHAPASRTFGNQATMASASVRSMHEELREAGGIARSGASIPGHRTSAQCSIRRPKRAPPCSSSPRTATPLAAACRRIW